MTIDPVLDGVPVARTPAVTTADQRFADAQIAEGRAQIDLLDARHAQFDLEEKSRAADAAVADAERKILEAIAVLQAEQAELGRRKAATSAAAAALVREQDTLRAIVNSVFTTRPVDTMIVVGTFDEMTEDQRRQDVGDRTVDVQSEEVQSKAESLAKARQAQANQADEVTKASLARDAAVAARDAAVAVRDDFDRLLAAAVRQVTVKVEALLRAGQRRDDAILARRVARLTAPIVGVDMTLVGLHAYWLGSATAPCAIPWWLLAGIGLVESGHGTAQGSQVGADGTTSKRILGIALDGRPGVATIGDTDGGLFDSDPTFDRAMGPMQFIPSTWRRWGRDGNGDELVSPHNLYDAAAAAANYLCFGRAAVTDDATMSAALLSYNRSGPYGQKVTAAAKRYRDLLDLPDLPPENTDTSVPTTPN